MKSKIKIFNLILSIVAPVLLVTVLVLALTYGWYMQRQQTATIDAKTKNLAVEYSFDDSEETNVIEYTVKNISFFDYSKIKEDQTIESTQVEMKYLPIMAVKLDIKLKNNCDSNISYKIKFESTKVIEKDDDDNVISIAYVDCVFNSMPNDTSSINEISELKTNGNGVTYTNTSLSSVALLDSTTLTSDSELAPTEFVTVSLYIFGVQEIDEAKNDVFLYDVANDNNEVTRTLKDYSFKLVFESVPLGEATVVEE